MSLYHAYSQTVADGTATSVVRPSDWNSAHNQQITLAGNTAGQSTISGTNIAFQGGNNVTLSAITAAGAATILVSGANTVAQTVQTQASGAIAGTGYSSTTTAGTAITAALGTNGLTMAVPAFITTYVAQTVQTQNLRNVTLSGNTSGTLAAISSGTMTLAGGNNITLSQVGNAVTISAASQSADTNKAGTGTTLALTNLSGTIAQNSNGIALSLNNIDDHLMGWAIVGNTAGTTGTTLTTEAPLYLQGGNNITLSGNSNTIIIQGAAGGGGGGIALAAGGSTATSGTVVFSNSNGVSFGFNGNTVTASIIANNTYGGWAPYADLVLVAGQQGQGTLYFEPEHSPYYFQDRVGVPIAYTNATNSTGSVTLSYWMGFYTQNVSTLSLASSTSFSTALTFSGTVASYSLFSGMRLLTFPWSLTVPEQEIWVAHLSRTTTAGANASISQMLVSNVNSNFVGFFGASHNTTIQFSIGQGVYTATTSGMPNSVAFSQIRGSDSIAFRAPAVMFINGTV